MILFPTFASKDWICLWKRCELKLWWLELCVSILCFRHRDKTNNWEIIFGQDFSSFLFLLGIFLPFDVAFPSLSFLCENRNVAFLGKRDGVRFSWCHYSNQSWNCKRQKTRLLRELRSLSEDISKKLYPCTHHA